MWRNREHYRDPTAGAALARIEKEERMNTGKRFEADWKASVPEDAWYLRLKDSPATFYGGAQEGVRFSADNICDSLLFRAPVLYLVELKTVGTPSASLESMFGKFDPARGRWKKQKHLEDMANAAQRPGIAALVVINFRARGVTYAVPAEAVLDFMRLTLDGGRRSIPPAWCAEHGVLVGQRQLRVNWRYDVAGMMERMVKNCDISRVSCQEDRHCAASGD